MFLCLGSLWFDFLRPWILVRSISNLAYIQTIWIHVSYPHNFRIPSASWDVDHTSFFGLPPMSRTRFMPRLSIFLHEVAAFLSYPKYSQEGAAMFRDAKTPHVKNKKLDGSEKMTCVVCLHSLFSSYPRSWAGMGRSLMVWATQTCSADFSSWGRSLPLFRYGHK